jgi:hypothetical protein
MATGTLGPSTASWPGSDGAELTEKAPPGSATMSGHSRQPHNTAAAGGERGAAGAAGA